MLAPVATTAAADAAAAALQPEELVEPQVVVCIECSDLAVGKFSLTVPLKAAPEGRSVRGLVAAVAAQLATKAGLGEEKVREVHQVDKSLHRAALLREERHHFYTSVQRHCERLAGTVQQMKRDYYREIDHLREQIHSSRTKADFRPDKVTFFDPRVYEIPTWERIVEELDGLRMKRQLLVQQGGVLVREVPVHMLCEHCRHKFQTDAEEQGSRLGMAEKASQWDASCCTGPSVSDSSSLGTQVREDEIDDEALTLDTALSPLAAGRHGAVGADGAGGSMSPSRRRGRQNTTHGLGGPSAMAARIAARESAGLDGARPTVAGAAGAGDPRSSMAGGVEDQPAGSGIDFGVSAGGRGGRGGVGRGLQASADQSEGANARGRTESDLSAVNRLNAAASGGSDLGSDSERSDTDPGRRRRQGVGGQRAGGGRGARVNSGLDGAECNMEEVLQSQRLKNNAGEHHGSIDARQAALAGLAQASGRLERDSAQLPGDEVGGVEGSALDLAVCKNREDRQNREYAGVGHDFEDGVGGNGSNDCRRGRRIEDALRNKGGDGQSPSGSTCFSNVVGRLRETACAGATLAQSMTDNSDENGLDESEENKARAAKIMAQDASDGNVEKARRCFMHWKSKTLCSRKQRAAKMLERQMAALQVHMQRVALAKLRKNAVAFGSVVAEKDRDLPLEKPEPESNRRLPRERQARPPIGFGSRPVPKPDLPADRDAEPSGPSRSRGPDLDAHIPVRLRTPPVNVTSSRKQSPPSGRDERPAMRRGQSEWCVRTPPGNVTSSLVRSPVESPGPSARAAAQSASPLLQTQRPQQQVASLRLDLDLPCDHLTSTRQRIMDRHARPRIHMSLRGLTASPTTMSTPSLVGGRRNL